MKRVIKYIFLAAIVLVVTVAITIMVIVHTIPHYFDLIVFPPGKWKIPPPKEITVVDARADLALLERAMRTGYIGYDYFQQRGTDWDALFAQADVSLADRSAISFCEFALTVQKLFRSVQDRHLNVWYAWDCKLPRNKFVPLASDAWFSLEGDAAIVADPAPAGVPVGSQLVDCEDRDIEDDLHLAARKVDDQWQLGRRIIYLTQKGREEITCRFRAPDGERIKARIAMTINYKYSAEKPIKVVPGEATYVRIGTFAPKEESDMSPFLHSAKDAARARAIVIDLRGNSGGSDRYFWPWSRDLFQGEKKYGNFARLTSETTRQSQINFATDIWAFRLGSTAMRAPLSLEAAKDFAALVALGAVSRGAKQHIIKVRPRRFVGRAKQPYIGEMVLIVDPGCASACESAVSLARKLFDALVVGANTSGTHVFTEPHPFRLPKSGLVFRMANKMRISLDQEGDHFYEGRGFMPDLWIDLRDGGAMARDFGSSFADPAFRDEFMPLIRDADERNRDLSVY